MQGYLFSPPVSVADFERMLLAGRWLRRLRLGLMPVRENIMACAKFTWPLECGVL